MSDNNIQNFKEEINDINKRLNNIVHFADTKKDFYNNIFFEKDKMTLYNIDFNSSLKDYNFNEGEAIFKQFNFDQPDKIFLLPSSDESGNESKNIYIPSFKQICDDIIDLEYFEFIKDDKAPPKGIYPFIFCRAKEPLTNINKVINYVKTNIKKDPYEIKIFPLYVENENKDILTLFMKFYSFEDAKIIAENLKNAYGNPVRVCFDKREIKDSKWYCVVFRMEGGGDQKLGKFVQLMDDIFKEIPGDEKKFLMNSFEGTCEGQINGVKCIRKLGEVFYCMIKVESIDQAVSLCVKYNNNHDLKVNLHNLTFNMKKSEMPQILIEKGDNADKKPKNKLKKSFKEDAIYQNEVADKLFPSRRMLSKKHKRNKGNKGS